MQIKLPSISSSVEGYEALTYFYHQIKGEKHVTVDMSNIGWFDAEMCSPFGAILSLLNSSGTVVELTAMQTKVERILAKNGFLSQYGHPLVIDTYNTTVGYKCFGIKDFKPFAEYTRDEFLGNRGFPESSNILKSIIHRHLNEVFANSVLHSETKLGIFTCGQLYPNQKSLDFIISDLGIGFKGRICRYFGLEVFENEYDYINWALESNNTTRDDDNPGGLGLKQLLGYVKQRNGTLRIVSNQGYWCIQNGKETKLDLHNVYPATSVHIGICPINV